jgi:hypothetical protein
MPGKVMKKIVRWVKNEDGFEVFEKFGLTQGGVLLALGVVAVAIWFMSDLWNGVAGQMGDGGLGSMTPTGLSEYQTSGWINN